QNFPIPKKATSAGRAEPTSNHLSSSPSFFLPRHFSGDTKETSLDLPCRAPHPASTRRREASGASRTPR
uniref:Uncharacterized protein n=1 Tax=Aegilops tauschii subsp. strangulata TaxID=200361 RepID=A0A453PM86_AEGTS